VRWPRAVAEREIVAPPPKANSYHLLVLVGLAAIISIVLRVGPFS
jgi:hypothetical protein